MKLPDKSFRLHFALTMATYAVMLYIVSYAVKKVLKIEN